MRNGSWKITDVLEGPFEQARIFWRLCGKEWTLRGNTASMGQASLEMKTLGDAAQPALIMTPGMMSRYYSELEPCQHLVATAARINSGQLVVETDVCFWQ